MNPNFNPEDLYTRRPTYMDGMNDDCYEDTIIRKGSQYALPTAPRRPMGPTYTSPMEHFQPQMYGKPNNSDIPTHIPQYHIQTMPQRSNIELLENDVNKLFDSSIFNVKDSNNTVGSEHDDELQPNISLDYDTSNLIRNNVNNNKHEETIVDHHIIIDSADRNVDKYPNPFSYRVLFNVSDTNDANISRMFEKVKNIKLETAILPKRYHYLKKDVVLENDDKILIRNTTDVSRNEFFNLASSDISGNFAVVDVVDTLLNNVFTRRVKFADVTIYPEPIENVYEYTYTFNDDGNGNLPSDISSNIISEPTNVSKYTLQSYNLHDNKFNLLNIDELSYSNEYSTSTHIGKSFAMLFPTNNNKNDFCTCPKYTDKIHHFKNPGQVSKMSISIRKYDGSLLTNSYGNYMDLNISRTKTCTCGVDENGLFIRDYRCACSYFRHPYYHHFQNTLIFKLQAYEIGLSTKKFD